jgi:hypothetical protein
MMLCDVIFASHDGFSMEILSQSDPLYTIPMTMPDYTEEELRGIVIKNKEFSKIVMLFNFGTDQLGQ